MQLRVGVATDLGRVRTLNEDVYSVRPDRGVFIVCDGMGGAPAGEVASAIAAHTILEYLTERSSAATASAEARTGYLPQTNQLAEAVRVSNAVIYQQTQAHPLRAGMGTTVVGAWIGTHVASVAHVGDSRAYLWRHDRLEAVTRDHSLVETQIRAGLLDREQGARSDEQHILLRAVGREPDVEVELNEIPIVPGDYLVLCSDGLTRMISERTVAEAITRLRHPQRICDHLVEAANHNGGLDNITVVVVQVATAWWRRLADCLRVQTSVSGGHYGESHPAS